MCIFGANSGIKEVEMDVKISEDFIANDPRFLDSIFNTSTIDTNLLLAGGLIIIAFVVFGKS